MSILIFVLMSAITTGHTIAHVALLNFTCLYLCKNIFNI